MMAIGVLIGLAIGMLVAQFIYWLLGDFVQPQAMYGGLVGVVAFVAFAGAWVGFILIWRWFFGLEDD
jgi:hypothetical protein